VKIGLAFPELGEHTLEDFIPTLRDAICQLDLLVVPEGFEIVQLDTGLVPGQLQDHTDVICLRERYTCVAKELGVSIVVGVSVDYHDASANGGGNDQYSMFVPPTGETIIYHKHSTSHFNAFFDDDWSIEGNFPVVEVNNVKVGLSICHDSYISLIPRVLKRKRAQVWINISFQNVRPHIWESVLQARASENAMFAVCTLHRNSCPDPGEGRPQKEPYAFSDRGKIKLRDLEEGRCIDKIPIDHRTGRIFYFDMFDYETYPVKALQAQSLASKACLVTICRDQAGTVGADPDDGQFVVKEIDIGGFLYSPERMWRMALDDPEGRVPLFVVRLRDNEEWTSHWPLIEKLVKGRVIEFSTLFLFVDGEMTTPLMAAYRSSNYKDARVFFPERFPIQVDGRYLKGLKSTYSISLNHGRNRDSNTYFERVGQLVQFLEDGD